MLFSSKQSLGSPRDSRPVCWEHCVVTAGAHASALTALVLLPRAVCLASGSVPGMLPCSLAPSPSSFHVFLGPRPSLPLVSSFLRDQAAVSHQGLSRLFCQSPVLDCPSRDPPPPPPATGAWGVRACWPHWMSSSFCWVLPP